jgi:flagella basal body P-ring formation protein FlgA
MIKSVKAFVGSLAGLACVMQIAQAEPYQSLNVIQGIAEQQVRNSAPSKVGVLRVQADNLDTRLRLAPCTGTPEAFLPNGMNLGPRATVGVRCNQGAQWTVYVAVAIESEAPVLVLNRAVIHDTPLVAADVEVSVRRLPGLSSGYLSDIAQLAGNSAKRDLAAGIILAPSMLQPTMIIRRGQQVTVLASVGGLEVRTEAIALSDGSANSRIRVKNLATAKVVEGIVDTSSLVHVDL